MWDISNINLIEPIIRHRKSSKTTVLNILEASWRSVHPLHPHHKRVSDVMWNTLGGYEQNKGNHTKTSSQQNKMRNIAIYALPI